MTPAPQTVRLVPFDRQYVPAVLAWIRDPEIRELVGTVRPPSDAQHERWYEDLQRDPTRYVTIVVEGEDDRGAGICGLSRIHETYRHAELWIYVAEAARRRRSIGREATRQLLTFAFETLGLHRVYVRVFGFNADARQFFLKCGFREEGVEREAVWKRGRFHDVWLMGMLASEFLRA